MKEKQSAKTAFIAWMKRYWPLVFILILFVVPIIVFLIYGASLDDALRAVDVIHAPVLGLTYHYTPGNDISLAIILLLILAFIAFSIIRFFYKSKK